MEINKTDNDLQPDFEDAKPRLTLKETLRSPGLLWLTWGGSGLMRPASGTWGSLAALPVVVPVLAWGGPGILLLFAALIYMISVFVVARHERTSGDHDGSYIVVDEVIGMAVTLSAAALNPIDIVAGFFLFRAFDAIKPGVVGKVDRDLSGAHGVLLDDVLAGALSALCLVVLHVIVG